MASQPPATNPAPQELTKNDPALPFNTTHCNAAEVIKRHTTELTTALGNDFHYFFGKFIELGFVTRTAAGDISTKLGIGNEEKGHQLLTLVIANYNTSRCASRCTWLEKVV